MGLFDDLFSVVNELKDEVGGLANEIKGTVGDAIAETTQAADGLKENTDAIVQGAKDKAGQPIEAVKQFGESFKGKIQGQSTTLYRYGEICYNTTVVKFLIRKS